MPIPKRNIVVQTPRGQISTYTTKAGKTIARLDWAGDFGKKRGNALMNAQEFIDSECLRCMNPLTPRDTGAMIKSGTLGTTIGSGIIQYVTPYARRQYYENNGKGQRGRLWFERMKAAHAETIRKGAERIAGK